MMLTQPPIRRTRNARPASPREVAAEGKGFLDFMAAVGGPRE